MVIYVCVDVGVLYSITGSQVKHIPVTDVDLSGSTTMVITIGDCQDVAIYLCENQGDVVNNYFKIVLASSENKVRKIS